MNILQKLKDKIAPHPLQEEVEMENRLSPPPQVAPETLSFGDAMIQLAKGKKITRVEWDNADYGFLKDTFVALLKDGQEFAHWNINDGDILATDWIVLEEN